MTRPSFSSLRATFSVLSILIVSVMDRSLATSSLGFTFGEWTSQKSPRDLQLGEPVEAGLVGEAVETAREAPGELLPSTWLLVGMI